jgi:hypothetical protein
MKSDFKEGRQGLAFKNGKLFEFTKRHVLVLSPWPDPRAWFKRRSHGWKATRKWADELFSERVIPANVEDWPESPEAYVTPSGFQGVLPGIPLPEEYSREVWFQELQVRERIIMDQYAATIPEDVRAELRRYGERRWYVLNLLARCPGAMELSHHHPALLFALASGWVFHQPAVQQPIRAARSLVNKNPKIVLEWLGFPATDTAQQIVGRVAAQSLSVQTLLKLRKLLADPEAVQLMSEVEVVTAEVVSLLSFQGFRSHVTPQLLADVSRGPRGQWAWNQSCQGMIRHIIELAARLRRNDDMCQFHSLKQLRDVHRDLEMRASRGSDPYWYNDSQILFGYPGIVPYGDEDDLEQVIARCELPEGEPLPLSWTYHNPMQMPLLHPADLAVYRHCLEIFKVRPVG